MFGKQFALGSEAVVLSCSTAVRKVFLKFHKICRKPSRVSFSNKAPGLAPIILFKKRLCVTGVFL